MMSEIEGTIWCPKCHEEFYTIERHKSQQEGFYTHETVPVKEGIEIGHKTCPDCDVVLERK